MPIPAQEVQKLVETEIPEAEVFVQDLTGTLDHYRVVVISKNFAGKSLVQRHQMVNGALKEPLKGDLHALTIEAYTPEQWEEKGKVAQPVQPQGPVPKGIKL